jgi:hypothetical protein
MAYLKPNVFTQKVFNPLAMRAAMGGSQALIVARRASGEPQRIPMIPVEHGGARYIVSTRGESDWVKNLRAAGGRGELVGKGEGGARFQATELPLAEREPVIAAYRAVAGRTVEAYWKKLPDAKDHPVFRIEAV